MVNSLFKGVKAVSEKGGIFTFIRAQFASQISSFVDFSVTILVANLFSVYYVIATVLGAVSGGIVNCIINYKWTFKAYNCKKKYVFIKFVLVWFGSIFLNTGGTYVMTEAILRNQWVQEALQPFIDNLFVFSKIIVSLIVGFTWNYNLQRVFVYKDCDLKGKLMQRKRKKSL